jgi:hypothetical protein
MAARADTKECGFSLEAMALNQFRPVRRQFSESGDLHKALLSQRHNPEIRFGQQLSSLVPGLAADSNRLPKVSSLFGSRAEGWRSIGSDAGRNRRPHFPLTPKADSLISYSGIQ